LFRVKTAIAFMKVMKPRATKMGFRSAIFSRLTINSQTGSIFPVQLTAGAQNQKISIKQEIVCGTDIFQGADPLPFPDWIMIMTDI